MAVANPVDPAGWVCLQGVDNGPSRPGISLAKRQTVRRKITILSFSTVKIVAFLLSIHHFRGSLDQCYCYGVLVSGSVQCAKLTLGH